MTERLMGVETEYAFLAFKKDGTPADARQAMTQIERLAAKHVPHLPARGQRGIFLQNASRFYRDPSNGEAHQEMTTPECPNPWDAVRYIVANEQILVGLAEQLIADNDQLGEALYFKHNVDYSGANTSWGSHESYLTRTPIELLPEHLVPHLVSRIVYTGAGGFDSRSRGLKFMLSPRVAHLSQLTSLGTEHNRPLFNLRDEPLCDGGFRRLHVICGESLCSHTSMWLRSATTSLVVALVDGGVQPGSAIALADPVRAMHAIARDATCRVKVQLAPGGTASAIEIQRRYLELAEQHVNADFMPPWAPQVCQHWRAILDQLDRGPEAVAATLDWAIKLSLYSDRLEQRGLDRNRLVQDGNGAPPEAMRQELFEVDVRYAQLGTRGIFSGLDRAGVLQHQFPGVDNFPHAMVCPPNLGRARLRGQAIQTINKRRQQGCCDWSGVWNTTEKKHLDLSRPFEEAEQWKEFPVQQPTPPTPPRPELSLQLVERNFNWGAFEQAFQDLQMMETVPTLMPPSQYLALVRLKAWIQARRGHLDGIEILNRICNSPNPDLAQTADHLYVLRLSGLAPRPEMLRCIQSAINRFGGLPRDQFPVNFRDHWGAYLVSAGQASEAKPILESAAGFAPRDKPECLRASVTLANAIRVLGKRDAARALLEEARHRQQELRLYGDLVDFTLPALAKLVGESNPATARELVNEAKVMQSRCRNWLGLVRSLMLDARLAAMCALSPHSNEAILMLAPNLPALATCQLYQDIMANWEVWTRDPSVVRNGDLYWGL